MATLELDPGSGRFRVRFRYDGQEFKRSLRTKHRRVAKASLGQVEETLRLLELGLTEIPSTVDEGDYIISGARSRREKKRKRSPVPTLSKLFSVYQEELPVGAKEADTLAGEKIHIKHLLRHLKSNTRTASLTTSSVQQYVNHRSKDKHNGKFIGPNTIKKEITTLRLVWNWAKNQGYLDSPAPIENIIFPKRDEKPPFMTMAEIERKIKRGGISQEQEAELWEALYLIREEVESLLDHVSKQEREPFVYPMFVLAAHTGMRRAEMLRSEVSDFDFEGRSIAIREKKSSRKHALSFRHVPMTALVEELFKGHFAKHSGKVFTLNRLNGKAVSRDDASHNFKATLNHSRWENVRGFHVFRHSFASNAAAEGIDQRMIDEWMGHQTEEMRRRYRHLAPNHQRAAIDAVFQQDRQVG